MLRPLQSTQFHARVWKCLPTDRQVGILCKINLATFDVTYIFEPLRAIFGHFFNLNDKNSVLGT